ncbi:MAG: hypothetical protein QXG12_04485 [Thermoproteota archaeon]
MDFLLCFRLSVEALFVMALLSQVAGPAQREASTFNPNLDKG